MLSVFSVALVGPDGAGKTTIAERLQRTFPLPLRVLYMGINTESSNRVLPTSRLIEYAKRKRNGNGGARSLHATNPARRKKEAGRLWATIRMGNRIAEEWYRQALSWSYRQRGQIVVYDRHFRFDFELEGGANDKKRFTDWFHRWTLAKLYPEPDMVIYLDAPAEVLYARKKEATVEWLDARRRSFLEQGKQMRNFVRVDATRPIDEVYAEVSKHITRFCNVQEREKKVLKAVESDTDTR